VGGQEVVFPVQWSILVLAVAIAAWLGERVGVPFQTPPLAPKTQPRLLFPQVDPRRRDRREEPRGPFRR
jgi:hypothetical protein